LLHFFLFCFKMSEVENKVNEYKDKGNKAFNEESYEESYNFYSEGLKLDNNNTLLLSNRSVALMKLLRLEEAIDDAKKVIELKPHWAKGYYRLGNLYYTVDKNEEALVVLKRGLEVDPNDEYIKRKLFQIETENNMGNSNQESTSSNNSFQRSWSEPKTEVKREYTSLSGIKLQICSGDITKEPSEAIVNAANNNLMLGGGVAGAIERAGGETIQQECDVWTELYGNVPDGQCGLSHGGNMSCKYVIHAVGPVWYDGNRNEDRSLLLSVYNSLLMANELQVKSISFPAISSGIFGFPKERCAKIMFHAFFQFCKNFPDTTVKLIRFANYDDPTVTCFISEFDDIFQTPNQKIIKSIIQQDSMNQPKVKDDKNSQ